MVRSASASSDIRASRTQGKRSWNGERVTAGKSMGIYAWSVRRINDKGALYEL